MSTGWAGHMPPSKKYQTLWCSANLIDWLCAEELRRGTSLLESKSKARGDNTTITLEQDNLPRRQNIECWF